MIDNKHKNQDKQIKNKDSSMLEKEKNNNIDQNQDKSKDATSLESEENIDKDLQNKDDSNNLEKNKEIELQEELEILKDEKLRLLAEMENLRKRFEKDKLYSIRYGSVNLARDILSTGDNLSRALESAKKEENKSESINKLIDGLNMIQKEFMNILNKHGVEKIDAMKNKFDHNFHQAVLEVETDEFDEGIVVQEIQSGFLMYDRLLRPSMVGVSKKLKNKKKEE